MRLRSALLAAALLTGCTHSPLAAPRAAERLTASATGKTLFAIYSIGADLEDDVDPGDGIPDEQQTGKLQPKGASSDDLREIVAGLKAMTPAQRANVSVLLMMGGARKQGWRGARMLDGDALVEDAQDDYFGNLPDARYLWKDPKASMADPATLTRFLAEVHRRQAGYARLVLELDGHGCSYMGMGADMNQPADQQWINLDQIGHAITASGVHGQVLAFSACYMASVEVARAAGAPFQYLIGSEEGMPDGGYDYRRVMHALATGASPEALGHAYVDGLFDTNPDADYKTASMTRLSAVPAIVSALDAWSAGADAPAFMAAGRQCHAFGLDAPTDPPTSLDARDLFSRDPRGAAVVKALDAAAMFHRGDPTYGFAHGLSIYPPQLKITDGKDTWYGPTVAASDGYWRVIQSLQPGLGLGKAPARHRRRQR